MGYVNVNPNPYGNYVGDCVVRAISIASNKPWNEVYIGLCARGYSLGDMPSSNRVWGDYLRDRGYKAEVISEQCPSCYSVKDFCEEYPGGKFILGTGSHVIAVIDGDYYDSWDSGDEHPVYYWKEE